MLQHLLLMLQPEQRVAQPIVHAIERVEPRARINDLTQLLALLKLELHRVQLLTLQRCLLLHCIQSVVQLVGVCVEEARVGRVAGLAGLPRAGGQLVWHAARALFLLDQSTVVGLIRHLLLCQRLLQRFSSLLLRPVRVDNEALLQPRERRAWACHGSVAGPALQRLQKALRQRHVQVECLRKRCEMPLLMPVRIVVTAH